MAVSRPAVSNDNPFSESLFSTYKGHPDFPDQPFEDPATARRWTQRFACWYDTEHRHSGLKFVTPAQRHRGEDIDLLAQRHVLYQAARAQHPERWSSPTRNWQPAAAVLLNPGKPLKTERQT
jgi:putative transposase